MPQKDLELVVTAVGPIDVKGPEECLGWGDRGQDACLVGPIAEIRVSRDGQAEFSLRILPNGDLILTNYQGSHEITVPQNLRLSPSRTWNAAEAKGTPDDD
jgi:hypothetical protein